MPAGLARAARFPSVALRVTTSPRKRYASSGRTNGLRRKVFLGDLFKPGGMRRRYRVCRGNPFPHAETSYGSSFGQVDHRRPQSFFPVGLTFRETIHQPVQVYRRGSGGTLPTGFRNPGRTRAMESRRPRCQQPMAPEHTGFWGCASRSQSRLTQPLDPSRGTLSPRSNIAVPDGCPKNSGGQVRLLAKAHLDRARTLTASTIVSGSLCFLDRVD